MLDPTPEEGIPDGVESEAKAAVLGQQKKIGDLREEILDLRNQVDTLTGLLASERSRADTLAWQLRRNQLDSFKHRNLRLNPIGGDSFAVIDSDVETRLIVIDVGAVQGMDVGVDLRVVDGTRVIARARSEDVRERITGALVLPEWKYFPQRGHRVVIAASTD